MTEQINKTSWPGWNTNKLIGRGNFGAVYEIEREIAGNVEKAALKVISIPQNASDIDELFGDGFTEEDITATFQSHRNSIMSEYTLMRKMNGCANIVYCDDIRSIQHEDGFGWDIFIKMELLTPLIKVLPEDITEDMVIKLAKDICSALKICKLNDVIHRDIKPQNIFVSPYGDYKLGDFGIAKTVEKTMGGTKTGTYRYMAPEVYNNQPYNATADIYSLGLVLYWMLNERRMPFLPLPPTKITTELESEKRLLRFQGKELPPPAHGSENLKRIVLKACAFAPKDRYASAEEMLKDLDNLFGVAVPVHVHKYSTEVTPPTCTEKGYTTYTCECGHSYQADETPALGHSFGEWNTTKQATKDQDGEERRSCTRCGFTETRPVPKLVVKTSKKKTNLIPLLAGAAAILAAVLLIPGLFGGTGDSPETKPSMQDTTTAPQEEPVSTLPVQLAWSDWMDQLPDYVTDENYEIKTQQVYSSRTRETTSSTDKNEMPGWELYDTVEADGDYGPWSEWSDIEVVASDTRKVKSEYRYAYRDKETTTASSSSKDGWTLYDTTYSWGNYGAWSDWSETPVSGSESRKVESKKQYQYCTITYTTEYTEYGSWSAWQDTPVTQTDLRKVETQIVYHYYYYVCKNCGKYIHGQSQCPSWDKGCGRSNTGGSYTAIWSKTPYSSAKDYGGTGVHYITINDKKVYAYINSNSAYYKAPITQYRYCTREEIQVPHEGEWSDWGDTPYTSSATVGVRERTVYHYCDRSKIPTYHFYRWSELSFWSKNKVTETENRKVDKKLVYSYQDKVTTTTYYFERWTEWSGYSTTEVIPADDVQVDVKTQYSYRPKQ